MGRNKAGNAAARSAKAKTVSVFGHPVPTWTVKTLAVLLAVEMAFGAWPSALANSLAFAEDDEERVVATDVTDQVDAEVTDDGVEEAAVQAEVQAVAEEILSNTEETSSATPDGYAGSLTASSGNYNVKVEFAEAAGIAEGSSLSVKEYSEGSAAYLEAFQLVNGVEYGSDEANGLGMDAIDISLIGPDGNEFEPAAEVSVSIERSSLPEGVTSSKELSVEHLDESLGDVQVVTVAGEGVPGEVAVEDNAIVADFDVKAFSTFAVTWYDYQWGQYRSANVHYVDDNGDELDVSNSNFSNAGSSTPAFLIYDIDGYEYDYTYRNSNQNTIYPLLRYNSSRWQYRGNYNWNNLNANDDIYVVYKKKPNVTQGGTPTLKPVNPEDYPEDPSILKESEPNGDGTANLSLSITGHTKAREVEKLADVIVVFDVSGSMDETMSGGTRIEVAKNAVNGLVDTLSNKKDSQGNPLIRMSLISFSTTAEQEIGLTDLNTNGVREYKEAVDALGTGGGTNWDYALQLANEQAVDSGRATFVIFVTDGNPTFRNTRMDVDDDDMDIYTTDTYQYYRSDNVYGNGRNDNDGNNYDAAVEEGQAIVGAKKNLYTIGISEDVDKVDDFNGDANGKGAYLAKDADQLNDAFEEIAASIGATSGVSDIQMTDGITEMTQTVEKSGLTGTDGNFTYWKKAKDSIDFEAWDPDSEGCEEAEYDEATGAVKWNMGTNFMPEDGATYKVTWKVWPSQNAYDILAKCQNDPSYYDTLTDVQKAQIIRTGTAPNYAYTLKTNKPGAGTTYKSATKSSSGIQIEGEDKPLLFNEVGPLSMASNTISIKKNWDNKLDSQEEEKGIVFSVLADGEDFGKKVELSPNNDWTYNNYNISCGLMTTTTEDGVVVYEEGHDFSIVEPGDLAYHWDFKSDVYRPMVIDGKPEMLIKVDTASESNYTIDGKFYKKATSSAMLEATNSRRSNLNISKSVVDAGGTVINPDVTFTLTVTVNEANGDDVWFSAQDASGKTIKNKDIAAGVGVVYQESDGFFHCPNGTVLTLTIKGGWNYRFTNLPVGSTYNVVENTPTSPYALKDIESKTESKGEKGTKATVSKADRSASGTIDKSNNIYSVSYTNEKTSVDLTIKKRITGSMANMKQVFHFTVINADTNQSLINEDAIELGNDGVYTITGIAPNTKVKVTETDPNGYTTSYVVTTNEGDAPSVDDTSWTSEPLKSDTTITFTNTMETIVITGIKKAVKSPITHILVIAVLVATASVAITRSRREQWTE